MISVRVFINASDKENSITPRDCDYFEEEFDNAADLARFIAEQTTEPLRSIEQMDISVDGGNMLNVYDIEGYGDDSGVDEWEFDERFIEELVEAYRKQVL